MTPLPHDLREAGLEPLARSLEVIEQGVTELWAANGSPQFTDHSVAHSRRVAVLADEIVGRRDLPQALRLTVRERYLLRAAALAHDIGMQDFRAASGEVEKLSEVRASHPRRSAEMIISRAFDTGLPDHEDIGRRLLALLVESHGTHHYPPAYGRMTSREFHLNNELVKLGRLAPILLMADELDLAYDRIATRQPFFPLGDASKAHFLKHKCVTGVQVRDSQRGLTISIQFDIPQGISRAESVEIVNWVIYKLERQIALTRDALEEGFDGHLFFNSKIDVQMDHGTDPPTNLYSPRVIGHIAAENAEHRLINHETVAGHVGASLAIGSSLMLRVPDIAKRPREVIDLVDLVCKRLEANGLLVIRNPIEYEDIDGLVNGGELISEWKEALQEANGEVSEALGHGEKPLTVLCYTQLVGQLKAREFSDIIALSEAPNTCVLLVGLEQRTPEGWLSADIAGVSVDVLADYMVRGGADEYDAMELLSASEHGYEIARSYMKRRMLGEY